MYILYRALPVKIIYSCLYVHNSHRCTRLDEGDRSPSARANQGLYSGNSILGWGEVGCFLFFFTPRGGSCITMCVCVCGGGGGGGGGGGEVHRFGGKASPVPPPPPPVTATVCSLIIHELS